MVWSTYFRNRNTLGDKLAKRFVNPVDESLLRRLDEQHARLRARGIQVRAVRQVRRSS